MLYYYIIKLNWVGNGTKNHLESLPLTQPTVYLMCEELA